MAAPEAPPLEESAQAIAQHLAGLQRQLVYPAGVAVSNLPDAWTDLWRTIQPDFYRSAEAAIATAAALREHLPGLAALYQGLALATEALDTIAERAQTGPIVEALTATLAPPLTDNLRHLACICEALEPVHTDLVGIQADIGDVNDTLREFLYKLVRQLKDMSIDVDVTSTVDLSEFVAALLKGLRDMAPELLPPAPAAGRPEPGSLFGQNAQASLNAVDYMLTEEGEHSPKIISLILNALGASETGLSAVAGRAASAFGTALDLAHPSGNPETGGPVAPVLDFVRESWEGLTEGGVATPQTAWNRGIAAWSMATAAGMLAHLVAAIPSVSVLGTVDVNLSWLAGLVGKAAGWDPIIDAFTRPLYYAYLNQPFKYETNRLARPFLPAVGELTRFRYKRMFERRPHDPCRVTPPFTFAEAMAYQGYSDQWIAIYEDDLYREPMARDLVYMAESMTPPEGWWEYKAQRLGYSDADLPVIVEAFKRRGARTQILDYYRRLWYLAERGYLSIQDFRERAEDTGLSPMAIDYGAKSAEAARELRDKGDLYNWAKTQYERDVLDDDGLKDALAQVYDDPDLLDRQCNLLRLKRTRAIRRLTSSEEARRDLPVYRSAFLASAITYHEYKGQLVEAGWENEALELRLSLDEGKRQDAMLARFRRFRLPALRDDVLHGMTTVSDYMRELRAAGFPDEYAASERAYVQAQYERRQAAALRAEQLPPYRTTYVEGLIPRGTLARAMEDAGLTPEGIDAELTVLDYRRQATEEARLAAEARERERQLEEERRDAERAKKEAERAAEEARRARDRQRAELERRAAQQAQARAADAKRAAEERRPGWPDEARRVRARIAAAYKDAGQLLPADVWQLGLDLEDELARVPGPDPELVDALIGRIEQSLARQAGVLPA